VTRKQERQRARRRFERQQAAAVRHEIEAGQARRLGLLAGIVVGLVAVLAVLGAAFSRIQPQTPETLAGCPMPPKSLGTSAQLTLPDKASVAGKVVTGTITTNCGEITVDLDAAKAPQAVASFVQLAQTGYWMNSPCARLTDGERFKVLQCGDPTGTGQGTPGYGFGVENAPADGEYPRGTLAMARTPDAQKGNGGQFFIVYGDTTIKDTNGYTIFGRVRSGLDIVEKVAAAGIAPGGTSATDGAPAAPLSILRVATTEKKA
jgi:peptidyl-prolyl cis-trans isomerase B (cyclophilin B)